MPFSNQSRDQSEESEKTNNALMKKTEDDLSIRPEDDLLVLEKDQQQNKSSP
ncbi:hypothetical protein H6761_03200 [Candidatus Nomurabacteria bacterium]|nr:hypothetical protein [Candidatus Nomurabacteria bacterium]